MMANGTGTNGGKPGMNAAQRRIAGLFAITFAALAAAIVFANVESKLSDLRSAGVSETAAHVWTWEVTSLIAWLTVIPVIWWAAARLGPPRVPWWQVLAIVALGSLVVSGWHVALMDAQRKLAYAAAGETYDYGIVGNFPYEYHKDLATYLELIAFTVLAQWVLARAADPPPPPRKSLAVSDGAVIHHVPIDDIDWIGSASNYVDIACGERRLLHRATLAAMADELGDAFVRIHRGRLVRRGAIRRVETDKSGDFTVTLENGESLRGSRRYRSHI
jgi:hypothetical protein